MAGFQIGNPKTDFVQWAFTLGNGLDKQRAILMYIKNNDLDIQNGFDESEALMFGITSVLADKIDSLERRLDQVQYELSNTNGVSVLETNLDFGTVLGARDHFYSGTGFRYVCESRTKTVPTDAPYNRVFYEFTYTATILGTDYVQHGMMEYNGGSTMSFDGAYDVGGVSNVYNITLEARTPFGSSTTYEAVITSNYSQGTNKLHVVAKYHYDGSGGSNDAPYTVSLSDGVERSRKAVRSVQWEAVALECMAGLIASDQTFAEEINPLIRNIITTVVQNARKDTTKNNPEAMQFKDELNINGKNSSGVLAGALNSIGSFVVENIPTILDTVWEWGAALLAFL